MASFYPDLYQTALALLIMAREDADLSASDLSGRFGLTEEFVMSYEAGQRLLDPAEFIAIARAIGVDPYELLRRAEGVNSRGRASGAPEVSAPRRTATRKHRRSAGASRVVSSRRDCLLSGAGVQV